MAKTTLKSLAQALNMSVSTVSKALNDSHEISAVTKKKIQEFAKQHNYQPNVHAKFLKTGRTYTIGVVLPKMTGSFEAQLIAGMQQMAAAHHYRIIIMNSMEDEELEKLALQSMLDKSVDGLLFCPIHEESNVGLAKQIQQTTPLVIFDRTHYPIETHKVGVLNKKGTYNACQHLFDIGRKKISIFCGTRQGITMERLSGYLEAHKDAHLRIDPEYMVYCNVQSIPELQADMETHVQRLLQLPHPPDAIIGIVDTITTHLLGTLAKLEVEVPDTLAVIGFANTDLALSLNPSLSAIRQPATEIGEISVNKLMEIIKTKHRSQIEWEDIKLPTAIQLRRSTIG